MQRIEITLPASLRFLQPVHFLTEKLLEGFSSDKRTLAVFPLAVQEILTNIIEHSYGKKEGESVKIIWEVDKESIRVKFLFKGKKVEIPSAKFDLERKVKERAKRGLGLEIVRRAVDEMEFGEKEGENWWIIKKKFKS